MSTNTPSDPPKPILPPTVGSKAPRSSIKGDDEGFTLIAPLVQPKPAEPMAAPNVNNKTLESALSAPVATPVPQTLTLSPTPTLSELSTSPVQVQPTPALERMATLESATEPAVSAAVPPLTPPPATASLPPVEPITQPTARAELPPQETTFSSLNTINSITNVGAQALQEALQQNGASKVETLSLEGNAAIDPQHLNVLPKQNLTIVQQPSVQSTVASQLTSSGTPPTPPLTEIPVTVPQSNATATSVPAQTQESVREKNYQMYNSIDAAMRSPANRLKWEKIISVNVKSDPSDSSPHVSINPIDLTAKDEIKVKTMVEAAKTAYEASGSTLLFKITGFSPELRKQIKEQLLSNGIQVNLEEYYKTALAASGGDTDIMKELEQERIHDEEKLKTIKEAAVPGGLVGASTGLPSAAPATFIPTMGPTTVPTQPTTITASLPTSPASNLTEEQQKLAHDLAHGVAEATYKSTAPFMAKVKANLPQRTSKTEPPQASYIVTKEVPTKAANKPQAIQTNVDPVPPSPKRFKPGD